MKLNTAKKLTAGALALSMMFAMAVPMAFAESMPEVDPLAPHITKNILLQMRIQLLRQRISPLPQRLQRSSMQA